MKRNVKYKEAIFEKITSKAIVELHFWYDTFA